MAHQTPEVHSGDLPVPVIRRATSEDADALARIGAETFIETFGPSYPPEDLQAFLAKSYAVEILRGKLEEADTAVWFAMLRGSEPAGFIMVARCKLPVESLEAGAAEVHHLYVYKKHHNLRLGSRLMDVALDWLASRGRAPLYVGVWSENLGALRLYQRYGFRQFGEYRFEVGNTLDRDLILKRVTA